MSTDQRFFIIQHLDQNRDSLLIARIAQGNSYISKQTPSFYPLDRTTFESSTKNFLADLNAFTFSALQYVTFNSDQRPFPFSDWPAPEDKKEN